MSQNTSHAVMAQRSEPQDSADYFPTPPWATRALCEQLSIRHDLSALSVWEPACGGGHMAVPLKEYFNTVRATDLHNYGYGTSGWDFLEAQLPGKEDWIITNPPFNLAQSFIRQAFNYARYGVAMLVRTTFLEGVGRYEKLFKEHPPTDVYQFTERVPMHKGKLTRTGSTATAYCWVVWDFSRQDGPKLRWIPPCRKKLERDADYGVAP